MLDFSDLQNEVIEHWAETGVEFSESQNVGFDAPDPVFHTDVIKPEFQEILDDPNRCIEELEYESLSEYIREKTKTLTSKVGVDMGYARISETRTKFFFESAHGTLEFFIDRNPENGIASLWISPDETEGGLQFVAELLRELDRAKGVK